MGLGLVLPLINSELLKYPKLARLYFSLLSYMLEVYPQHIAALAPEHFASLMATLKHGLAATDPTVAHCCLEGLAGLAKFQYAAQQAGQLGLGAHTAGAWRRGRLGGGALLPAGAGQAGCFASVMAHLSRHVTPPLSRSCHAGYTSPHTPTPHPPDGASVIAHFQGALLQRLLLEDLAQELVELAGGRWGQPLAGGWRI